MTQHRAADGPPGPGRVEVTEDGHVLVVTFDRPAKKNAITPEMARAVAGALDRFEADPRLRCAVISGRGGTFCAGMDLNAIDAPDIAGRGFAGITEWQPGKPVIAAVEGYAVGGGLEIALACDLIVAGRDAMFGLPEVSRGNIAGGGGLLRLPRRIPYAHAARLALTGELFTVEQADGWGMLSEVAEPGHALTAACRLAHRIAGNAPLAVQATVTLLRQSRAETAGFWALQHQVSAAVAASPDAAEGAEAFAAKRPPHWTGPVVTTRSQPTE